MDKFPFYPISFCYKGFQLWNYVHLPKKEQLMILKWRNLYTEYFLNNKPISEKEHFSFIDSLKRDKTKLYWLVKDKNEIPLGCIYLNPINWNKKEAFLGLFKNPSFEGVGSILLNLLLDISKEIFHLKVLKLEVLETNKRAIKLYTKHGFHQIGSFKKKGRKFLTFEKKL
jgi:UDP-4-amino-4,6-dideoxy-N-acetyl-beta-L-altrosamine N-acetyltransferase